MRATDLTSIRLLAGASLLAISFSTQLGSITTAEAACSTTNPANGVTVNCTGDTPETNTVGDGNASDVTVNVIGGANSPGGIIISGAGGSPFDPDRAINLGDRVTINAQNNSQISVTSGFATGIQVGNDSTVNLGNLFTSGKIGSIGVSAGDNLNLLLREGSTVQVIGGLLDGTAINAGDNSSITIAGQVQANSGPVGGPFDGKAANLSGIATGVGSTVNVTQTGSINVTADGIGVIATNPVDAGASFAAITVDGAITTINGNGIHFIQPNVASVASLAAPAVNVLAASPDPIASIIIGQTGSVASQNGTGVLEDAGLNIDTTLRVAGTLTGGVAAQVTPPSDLFVAAAVVPQAGVPMAASLGGGDDTFVYEASAQINGIVDAGTGGETNGDTFALGGSRNGTFDVSLLDGDGTNATAQYINFENFEKIDSGTFTLTGTNTGISKFSVLGGSLYVNGSMPNTDFPVASGALLGGNGTIGSLLAMTGATVAPGVPGTYGVLTTTGNATFESGSTFEVALNAAGNNSRLDVGGATSIQGGTIKVDAAAGLYDAAQRYTIINSTGGVTGRFSGVVDNLPDVDFTDNYLANSVYLGVTVQQNGTLSAKQNGLAAAYGAGNASNAFAETLARRTDVENPGPSLNGITVPLGYADETEKNLAMKAVFNADLPEAYKTARTDQLAIWIGGFGENTSVDGSSRGFGYDSNALGAAGGLEARMYGEGTAIVGLAVGYSKSNIDVTNGGADVDAGHVGLYGSYALGNASINGALAYSFFNYDLSRSIPVGAGFVTATGDAHGDALSGFVEGFYDLAPYTGMSGVKFGPVARLRGVDADRGGYTETGAGILDLTVNKDSVTQFYAAIGGRIEGKFDMSGVVVTPQLDLMYENAVSGNNSSSIAAIPAAGALFDTSVSNGNRSRFLVGAGVGVDFNPNFSAHARYDGSFGSDIRSNRGSVGITYKF